MIKISIYGKQRKDTGTATLLGAAVRDPEKLPVYQGTALQRGHRDADAL